MTALRSGAGLASVTREAVAARPMLVSVIGPPGAGKSTIVATLTTNGGMPVFRLRETVRQRPDLLAGFVPSTDSLGWISLEAVRRVLHAVLVEERLGFGSAVVLLDNFPGTVGQLDLLAEVATQLQASPALLELHAAVETVVTRVAQRRVCLACGPDAHAPAIPAPGDIERCSACGATLFRRDSDVPRLHGLRLARYSANLPEITETAVQRGIPHARIDADAGLVEVCASAHHALGQLTALTVSRRH